MRNHLRDTCASRPVAPLRGLHFGTPFLGLLSSVAAWLLPAGAAPTTPWCFGFCFDFSGNIVSKSSYQPNSAHYTLSMKKATTSCVSWLEGGWHRPVSHPPCAAFLGSFPEASARQRSVLLSCPHDREAGAIALAGLVKTSWIHVMSPSPSGKGHTSLTLQAG